MLHGRGSGKVGPAPSKIFEAEGRDFSYMAFSSKVDAVFSYGNMKRLESSLVWNRVV